MKLNFKKIASVLASTVMLTSTIGFAAAGNYPAPFTTSGGAVVYGEAGLSSDATAAFKLERSMPGTASTSTTVTTSGETVPLSTGSTKLYVNDSINSIRSVLTRADLPNVLAKGTFSGNVEATFEQTIVLGSFPAIKYQNTPTSSDASRYALITGSTAANYLYNATITFSKAVNFTSADSKNQELTLFGQKFTVGSGTDVSNLILFKSATTLNFDSTGTTSGEVTISGKTYTVELTNVPSTSTSANIKVTDDTGVSQEQTITVGSSKKVAGITVAVITASSSNQKFTASIVAGAEKITIPVSSGAITTGDSGNPIDGTSVSITGGTNATTAIVLSIFAPNSDKAALQQGDSFTDPVFKTFKLDFSAGMNIGDNSTDREVLEISRAGDDKIQVKGLFKNTAGEDVPFNWAKNTTSGSLELASGDQVRNITVYEGAPVYKGDYVVVGNEDSGKLLKVYDIYNSTSTDYSLDRVTFQDVGTGETLPTVLTAEGAGTVTVAGKSYNVVYTAAQASASDNYNLTVISSNAGTERYVYPSIQTANGAKVMFYEPLNISIKLVAAGSNLTGLKIPNGNGFATLTIASGGIDGGYTLTAGTGVTNVTNATFWTNASGLGPNNVSFTVDQLTYNLVGSVNNSATLTLVTTNGSYAAMIIIEGKDDNAQYNANVVTLRPGATSTTGLGVNTVYRTWTRDASWKTNTDPTNSNLVRQADLYGVITTLDSTTNQKSAKISIPKEQIYGNLYLSAAEATISGGGGAIGGVGKLTAVEDTAAGLASIEDLNIIVVGGSCVNKAAAKILTGSDIPVCGADFTTLTQVSATQYIIKTVASPYNSAKIAVLVAGYEAAETISAVDTLINDKPATDVNSSQVYPIIGTAA